MDILRGLAALPLTIVTSVLLIFLGIIYFVIAFLMVWVVAGLVNTDPTKDALVGMSIIAAAIMTAGALIGSAIQKESE